MDIKEIIQHLIDCERIFCYRALAFARKDQTNLPGFEEDDYADASNPDSRSIDELLSDFEASRNSTIKMFESFNEKMLMNHGICNNIKDLCTSDRLCDSRAYFASFESNAQ